MNKKPHFTSGYFCCRDAINRVSTTGFTLVELIVVITILAILGTNIQKGLELYQVKAGSYPTPDNSTTFSGGTNIILKQGILGDSVSNNINLNETVTDPLTKENYIYSTILDGKYYQLYSELENTISFKNKLQIIPISYADSNSKIPVIKGNYTLDPSLPSLLITDSTKSIATNSGIFDPNICFVLNNSTTNYLSSSSGTCTPKKNLSLKDYDTGLVGYWDMETLTGTLLKDLSGNGNDGIFSGTILPTLTGGHIGKGFYFTKSDNRIFIPSFTVSTYSDKFANGYTISAVVMKQTDGTTQGRIFGGFDAPLLYFDEYEKPIIIHYNIKNKYSGTRTLDYQNSNKFLFIVGIWDTNSQKIYINGILNNKNIVLDRLKISASTSNVTIGTASDINGTVTDSAYSFPGIIDDIKIYNRALSDEEIKQHAKIAGF